MPGKRRSSVILSEVAQLHKYGVITETQKGTVKDLLVAGNHREADAKLAEFSPAVLPDDMPGPGKMATAGQWKQFSVKLEGSLLKKKKKGMMAKWQRRYFILCVAQNKRALHYFASKEAAIAGEPPSLRGRRTPRTPHVFFDCFFLIFSRFLF